MSALPAPLPGSSIEAMIEDIAEGVRDGSLTAVSTKSEALDIYGWFRRHDPGAMLDYLHREAVDILAQRIQMSLAHSRMQGRKSAFASYERGDAPRVLAFERQYHCADGAWRRAADMVRPDWFHIQADRAARARMSLFEVEFARRVAAKLPDDTTPTSHVLTEKDLERLEQQAWKGADKVYQTLLP